MDGPPRLFGFLLRSYSYIFHLTLSSFLLGSAAVAASRHQILDLGMLPIAGDYVARDAGLLGVAGLICALLGFTRGLRLVFPLWAGLILYLMVKGFFLGPYAFDGAEGMKLALWLTLGALGAFFGALGTLKARHGRYVF